MTKQRQAERALRLAERKYRLLFQEAIVGMYQSAPDRRLLTANPAMAQMFGFASPRELIGRLTDTQFQIYVDPARRESICDLGGTALRSPAGVPETKIGGRVRGLAYLLCFLRTDRVV